MSTQQTNDDSPETWVDQITGINKTTLAHRAEIRDIHADVQNLCNDFREHQLRTNEILKKSEQNEVEASCTGCCSSSSSDSSVILTLNVIGIVILMFMMFMLLILHFRTWRMAKEANAWIQLYLYSQPSGISVVPDDVSIPDQNQHL